MDALDVFNAFGWVFAVALVFFAFGCVMSAADDFWRRWKK